MPEAYIAGSILHVDKEHWGLYERLGEAVENFGLNTWIPHIHTSNGLDPHGDILDPVHVFNKNMEIVQNAKIIIAEVSNPSIGTGIEIGVALNLKKPLICLVQKGAKLTRMIRGPAELGLLNLIIYENQDDAISKLKDLLEKKFKHLI